MEYYITHVRYKEGERKYIKDVKLSDGSSLSKFDVIMRIGLGNVFRPKYSENGQSKIGEIVRIVRGNSMNYIRSGPDDKEEDDLGELPEF